ncbi:GNAT family N-acetyltransferase [Streptomyces californicus]|uniref:GNAT family N-acetyltransferase n=1 Tax=Streptomyces californicus TaxID=67351 RepID=UPI0037186B73
MLDGNGPDGSSTSAAGVPVTIWVAERDDLDTASRLLSMYLDFYEVEPADPGRTKSFLAQRIARRDSLVLLASAPEIGTVGFAQVYPGLSTLELGVSWLLSDLFVAPDGRGRGVGGALVREVVERAREEGARSVHLETAYDNTPAQRLYEAEGFVRDPYHVYIRNVP